MNKYIVLTVFLACTQPAAAQSIPEVQDIPTVQGIPDITILEKSQDPTVEPVEGGMVVQTSAVENDKITPGKIAKKVLFDVTTYAPAAIFYDADMRDWNSSQPFFRNGDTENNARFTISGIPATAPLSYGAGKHLILHDTLDTLEMSLLNNTSEAIITSLLIKKFPEHKKLIRVIGWIEKGTFGVYWTSVLASPHYEQWRTNVDTARKLGYK